MATLRSQVQFDRLEGVRFRQESLLPAGWLFIRLVLGIEWLRAGWEKIGDAGWTASPVGGAVEGYLNGAIARSTGERPEVQGWFADLTRDVFLPNADVFAYLVAYGEFLVGLALIIGLFTRVSALFGVLMNLAFLFAGTTSSNPQMLLLGLALAVFGATAGLYGMDRWVLPWLREKVDAGFLKIATRVSLVAAATIAALLAWIVVDPEIWFGAAAVALLALFASQLITKRSA